jgi:hypothetical protein
MKRAWLVILIALFPAPQGAVTVTSQSLVDMARREAERRRRIDEQGIPVKRIEFAGQAQGTFAGAISVFSLEKGVVSQNASTVRAEPRVALRSFQTRLQKLDGDIQRAEERLKLLRARAEAERWAPIKTAKGSRGSGSSAAQDQLRWQILELEGKVAGLRRDRSDTFQAGRKAGYLPGELEGRGIAR